MKLKLGAGQEPEHGYINVDIRDLPNIDVVSDVMFLKFPANYFSEIKAIDILEHLTFVNCKLLLRRCYGWLEPNGIINIQVPNLDFLFKFVESTGEHEAMRWIYGSDGEGDTKHAFGFHKWGYTRKSLSDILLNIGYEILVFKEWCYNFAYQVIAVKR